MSRAQLLSSGASWFAEAPGAEVDAGHRTAAAAISTSIAACTAAHGRTQGLEIHEIMLAPERTWRSDVEVHQDYAHLAGQQDACAGVDAQGLLRACWCEGGAPKLFRQLMSGDPQRPHACVDWVNA